MQWLTDLITAGGSQWYEALPFVAGLILVLVNIVVHWWRSIVPTFDITSTAVMFGEGTGLCVVAIYAFALMFAPRLALLVAEKNGKVIAGALVLAFFAMCSVILNHWRHEAAAREAA